MDGLGAMWFIYAVDMQIRHYSPTERTVKSIWAEAGFNHPRTMKCNQWIASGKGHKEIDRKFSIRISITQIKSRGRKCVQRNADYCRSAHTKPISAHDIHRVFQFFIRSGRYLRTITKMLNLTQLLLLFLVWTWSHSARASHYRNHLQLITIKSLFFSLVPSFSRSGRRLCCGSPIVSQISELLMCTTQC